MGSSPEDEIYNVMSVIDYADVLSDVLVHSLRVKCLV